MNEQELKIIANLFGCICDYSPTDDYMSEHCEHELSKFIEYIKRSRYVKNHANIPYDVFEKEAIKSAEDWEKLTKEEFENE